MTRRQAIGWLVLVTLVWGTSFTLTKHALTAISPLVYMGIRFAMATTLIAGRLRRLRRPELQAGAVLGGLFWSGFVFQTKGLVLTTPSRSAFITSLSSILVPLVAFVAFRTRPGWRTVLGIAVATVGMYLLTAPDGRGMNLGDLLTVGCALLFAGHIVAVEYYTRTRRLEHQSLLAVQLGLTALLAFATAPLLETPRLTFHPTIAAAVVVLALTGLWSFSMQLRAQREVSAADAALVYLLEPVFATLISFLALGERFTPLQWMGGVIILLALTIAAVGTATEPTPPQSPADVTKALPDPDTVKT